MKNAEPCIPVLDPTSLEFVSWQCVMPEIGNDFIYPCWVYLHWTDWFGDIYTWIGQELQRYTSILYEIKCGSEVGQSISLFILLSGDLVNGEVFDFLGHNFDFVQIGRHPRVFAEVIFLDLVYYQ